MSGRRLVLSLIPVALAAAGALAIAGPPPRGVERRVEEGSLVYTMRPSMKPREGMMVRARPPRRPVGPAHIEDLVREVSRRYDLDPGLVATVISVESGFDRMAVSPKGARGLMQLMPATARQYGVRDVHDPRENLEGGAAYLRDLVDRYKGDLRLALAAYNAGPEAVERASGIPNYRETLEYLRKIEARYGRLAVAGMPEGGTTRPKTGGAVRVSRDAEGTLVLTNKPSGRMRGPRKPAR